MTDRKSASQRSQSSQPSPRRKETANLPDLIETLNTKEGLRFFMSDGSCKDFVLREGIIYVPTRPTFFPIPDEKALDHLEENDEALFEDIREFIFDHLDCSDERHYRILAAFTLHTHQIEKAEASPIIRFYGPKGSGKSRGGEVLSHLTRRGVSTANLTGPGLFRVNELYSPTFIIDEIQIYGKKGDKDLKDMLNVRYRRGNKIIRINKERNGLQSIETFNAFGPTVLCGTEELPDTVKSRSITFSMEPNLREVNRHLDRERASNLRNRLTAFRFRHFKTLLEEPHRVVSNGRLDEVLLPLHQIIKLAKPVLESEFVAFAKSLETDRIEEDFESFDAEVCRALIDCNSKVVSGKLSVQDVTSALNATRGLYPLSERAVGSVLSRFGLKVCRIAGTGKYGRIWDQERIRRLAIRFGIDHTGCEGVNVREGCKVKKVREDIDSQEGKSQEITPPVSTQKEVENGSDGRECFGGSDEKKKIQEIVRNALQKGSEICHSQARQWASKKCRYGLLDLSVLERQLEKWDGREGLQSIIDQYIAKATEVREEYRRWGSP